MGFRFERRDEKYSKRRDGLMSLIWPFGAPRGERPHVHPSLAAEKLLVEANAAIMNAPRSDPRRHTTHAALARPPRSICTDSDIRELTRRKTCA